MVLNKEEVISIYDNLKTMSFKDIVEESDYIMILNKGLYVGDGLDKTKIFIEPNEDHVDTYMITYFLSEVSNVNDRIISANGTSFLISKQTIGDLKDKGMSKNSIKSLKYIPRFA